MKTAIATLKSCSPYSQSKNFDKVEVPIKPKELSEAYEARTWRNRMHVDSDGCVFIPGTSFANALKQSAKRLRLQVPGKGKSEYTKYFEAGVMVPGNLKLNVKADEVPGERLFVPSDGKPGGGKRVYRTFPRIDSWSGDVTFWILDDLITDDVFEKVLIATGHLVGIGRFRPENRGFYGRFSVEKIVWAEGAEALLADMAAE